MLSILITLIILGFALWMIQTYIPMDPLFKNLITVVVVIAVLVWLFGERGHLHLRW